MQGYGMDVQAPAFHEVRKRRTLPPIRWMAAIVFVAAAILAFFMPQGILFYLVGSAALIWLECRPHGPASLWEKPLIRGMRDVAIAITIIVIIPSLELPDNISFCVTIAAAFFWLEIVRCRHSSILLQILLTFCLSIILFLSLHFFALPRRIPLMQYNDPIALAGAALVIAVAYLRYQSPAQKAAIMLLGWGAVANLAYSLWRAFYIPRRSWKGHELVAWFYTNFSYWLFATLFALPMIVLAVRKDRVAKIKRGGISDVATALYAIAAPALFTALLSLVYPSQIHLSGLRAEGNIYQLCLAVLMYVLVALAAIALDRRVIIFSVSIVLMLMGTKALGGLTGCALLGLALCALNHYWQPIRRALLVVVPVRT